MPLITAQEYGLRRVLPRLIEWFNEQPINLRIIPTGDNRTYIANLHSREGIGYIFSAGTNLESSAVELKASFTYEWVGPRDRPVTADETCFIEISKFIHPDEIYTGTKQHVTSFMGEYDYVGVGRSAAAPAYRSVAMNEREYDPLRTYIVNDPLYGEDWHHVYEEDSPVWIHLPNVAVPGKEEVLSPGPHQMFRIRPKYYETVKQARLVCNPFILQNTQYQVGVMNGTVSGDAIYDASCAAQSFSYSSGRHESGDLLVRPDTYVNVFIEHLVIPESIQEPDDVIRLALFDIEGTFVTEITIKANGEIDRYYDNRVSTRRDESTRYDPEMQDYEGNKGYEAILHDQMYWMCYVNDAEESEWPEGFECTMNIMFNCFKRFYGAETIRCFPDDH